jgi:hypothetical protein
MNRNESTVILRPKEPGAESALAAAGRWSASRRVGEAEEGVVGEAESGYAGVRRSVGGSVRNGSGDAGDSRPRRCGREESWTNLRRWKS